MRHLGAALIMGLATAACAFDPAGSTDPEVPPVDPSVDAAVTGPTVRCRGEGPALGIVGLIVDAGAKGQFRFDSWTPGSGASWTGFTLSGPANAAFEVRTGRTKYWALGLSWTHPDLAGGAVHAISRVDFCVDHAPGPGH